MVSHRSLLLHSICKLGRILLVLSAVSNLSAQSLTAPTASEDPEKVDQIWQEASSKYDAQRSAVLKEVDSVNQQGPFRPDWELLQKYEAPGWYRDAKFGIFIRSPRSGTNGIHEVCIGSDPRNISIISPHTDH
jgi:hypothetical protein